MWIPYALTTAILTSLLPILNKRLLINADVSAVAWGVNALSLPLLGLVTFLLQPRTDVDGPFWIGILGSGFLNMVATWVSTQALKFGEASLVTPFLSFNPVFTLLVAFFVLAEVPTLTGGIGSFIIAIGAYLFAIEEIRVGLLAPLQALLKQPGILLAILASFIWGVTPILEKIAIQHSTPENPPLVAFATTATMSLLFLPVTFRRGRKPIQQIASQKLGFGAAGVIAGIAPVFGFTAMAIGHLAYVTALFKLSSVFTVLFAFLLLGERNIRQRLLGSAVMAAGAAVLVL